MTSTIRKQLSGLLKRNQNLWPDPEASTGTLHRKMGRFYCWEAVGPARELFIQIAEEIKIYLEKSSDPVSHTVTWTMYMIGLTKQCAKPTIMFCCQVPSPRKQARRLIEESAILEKYPGIVTGDSTRPPDFDQLVHLTMSEGLENCDLDIAKMKKSIFFKPSQTVCGIQIYIKDNICPNSLPRKATIGGVLLSGDKYFCLTVAHAFTDSDQTQNLESRNDSDFEFDIECQDDIDEDVVDMIDATNTENETQEIEDALVLSSMNGPCPGLDYALIETRRPEFQTYNRQHSIVSSGQHLPYPHRVASTRPDHNTEVLAATASNGALKGTLSGTPTFMKTQSSNSFQEVWTVRLVGSLKTGDCGSWVVNLETGDLFGHIIAESLETGVAYIIPAYQIFADIKARFKLDLRLPTRDLERDRREVGDLVLPEESRAGPTEFHISTSDRDFVRFLAPWRNGILGSDTSSNAYWSPRSCEDQTYASLPNMSYAESIPAHDGPEPPLSGEISEGQPLFNIEKDGDPRIMWYMYYDFVVTKTEAYYQLQPRYLATERYPARVRSEKVKFNGKRYNPCGVPGCISQPFARHYDLERHFRTVHISTKDQMHCDYPKCPHKCPFRKDHCREHYREYHMEDLPKLPILKHRRGGQKNREMVEEFLARRRKHVNLSWWRCVRCLQRVEVNMDGYTCPRCAVACEPERVTWREQIRASTNSPQTGAGDLTSLGDKTLARSSPKSPSSLEDV